VQKISRRCALKSGFSAFAAMHSSAISHAQDTYPNRPVSIINPFTPGSISDAAARIISNSLQEQFGQPFIVENKVGGSGLLAGTTVQRAKPDGYTLMLTASSSFSGVALYKSMPFDPVNDFTHIARIGSFPSFIASNPKAPFTSIQELIAYAKANPGALSYGHGNNVGQVAGEILKKRTGVNIVRVPYRSNPAAVTDLLAGTIPIIVPEFNTGLAHAEAGRMRPLAVLTKERNLRLPNVPSLHETVLPGFDILPWCGLSAPTGLPSDITGRLATAVGKALSDAGVRQRFFTSGIDVFSGGPQEFQSYIVAQIANWTALIKDAGIEPES